MPIIATQATGARNAMLPAPAIAKTTAATMSAPQNHIMRECLITFQILRFAHTRTWD